MRQPKPERKAKPVDDSPIFMDPRMVHYINDCYNGSKALCAAVLKTGRTYGPLNEAQQIEAIEYAHDVKSTGRKVKRVPRQPARIVMGALWGAGGLVN
jgi:hypothetical protein